MLMTVTDGLTTNPKVSYNVKRALLVEKFDHIISSLNDPKATELAENISCGKPCLR